MIPISMGFEVKGSDEYDSLVKKRQYLMTYFYLSDFYLSENDIILNFWTNLQGFMNF